MTSDYEQRRAARAKRLEAEDQAERKKEVIVGETTGEVEKDIRIDQELKVKIHEVDDLHIQSSVDLKKGDRLKITIKADPALSEGHTLAWGREHQNPSDETYGTLKGKIKAGHDLKVRIENMNITKVESSVELDKGDSIRIVIEKA
ncbi:MAG: hypothetical protein JW712_11135 [Dehalococcoidales bacterium]|nr:hypothetical protein [Dehalococcoidales bacterium]